MTTENLNVPFAFSRKYQASGNSDAITYEGDIDFPIERWVDNSAVNPNWRDDIRAGNCATTPLTGYLESYSRFPASFSVDYSNGDYSRGTECDDQLSYKYDASTAAVLSCADNLARTKIVRKANEYQRPFSGGVALGELRETLRMIKRPGKALWDGINRHIERARRKTARLKVGSNPYRRTASGLWLESVFGWTPLFSDIESGAKALSSLANNASKRRKLIVANSKCEDQIESDTFWSHYSKGWVRANYTWLSRPRAEVRYRAMLQWDASSYSKFRYFGLTPSDILPTAWELVPWSFLVDYFTNIGEIIEGYSFGVSRLRWVDRGIKLTLERKLRLNHWLPYHPTYTGVGSFTPEISYFRKATVSRSQVFGFDPVPDLNFEIPGSRQFANMAALFSNKKRYF